MSNITQHTKNQENLNSHGKRPSIATKAKITDVGKLSDKDFQAAIINMLQQVITNILKAIGKIENPST